MGLTKPRAAQIFNLDYKQSTRVVTATNINLSGGAPSVVDGVNLVKGDRILVTGQTTGSQNGLYLVATLGSGSNGTWARTSDGNENGEIEAGMIVMVTEGAIYADTQWKLITDDPIVINTTALTFTQNYMANSISGGTSNVVVNSNANVTISSAGTANVLLISSTGTVTSGSASVTGNVTANYFLGNVACASGIFSSRIFNGTSEANIGASGGNVNVSVGGTSNVAVFATTGQFVTGLLSATGNVTGGNLNTAGNVSATGNIAGNYLLANIYFATGFSASRIFNGTSEANIGTSGGNANISIGGVSNVVVFATTGQFITGLLSVTGNIIGGNISATNHTGTNVSVTGTVTSASVVGGVITGSSTSVTGTQTAASTVGGVITGSSSSLSGNVTGGNVLTGGLISATGNLNAANIIASKVVSATDNLIINSTGAEGGQLVIGWAGIGGIVGQANSTWNLDTDSSNVFRIFYQNGIGATNVLLQASSTSNVITFPQSAGVSATGNVTGSYFIGNGSQLTGVVASAGNSIVNGTSNVVVAASGNVTVGIAGTSAVATFTTAGLVANSVATTNNGTGTNFRVGDDVWIGDINIADTMSIRGQQSALNGYIVFGNADGTALGRAGTGPLTYGGAFSASGNVTGGNLLTGSQISATGNITSAANISGGNANITTQINTTSVSASGNIRTAGTISATGSVTAASTIGGVITGTSTSVSGTQTAASTVGGVITGSSVSVTGTATAASTVGGVITGTSASVTGGVTAASVAGGVITGTSASVTGNITGANLVVATNIYDDSVMNIVTGSGNINLQPAGNVVINSKNINGLAQPVQNQDAATKLYVDNAVSTAISYHQPVVAATTTTLATTTGGTVTYSQPNGASNGVGALLTTTGSFNLIDTANVQTLGTRILVKNEANAVFNGVYTWANATNIVRATDADTAGVGNTSALGLNDYFFVSSGNVNLGSAYIVSAPTTAIVFGTSNIAFAQFSQSQVYTANTQAGINLAGTVINAKVDNTTTAFDGGGNISVKASANLTTPNIGAATGTSLSVTGAVTAASTVGGVITGSSVSVTGTQTAASTVGGVITGSSASVAGTVTGASLAGTITTASQTNITAVGTLGSLSVSGNITGGNISATSHTGTTVSVTGTVTAASTVGGVITGTSTSVSGGVTAASVAGGVITGSSISVTGAQTAASTVGGVITGTSTSVTGAVSGASASVSGTITAASTVGGVITGSSSSVTGTQTAASTVGGVITGSSASVTGTVTGASIAGGIITGTSVSVTGNTTAGNVLTGGLISATGNITGGNVLGNGAGLSGINVFSNVTVTGGNSAVADSIADTLTLTAGTGITIVIDPTTDTITIGAQGGSEIFVDGADFGTVTEPVTLSDDLGLVTDLVDSEADLGTLVTSGLIYPDQFVLPSYTTSTLPSAAVAGAMIYVTNETGGPVPAFADGTNWRRVTDRAIVT